MKRAIQSGIFFACVGLSALGAYNVMSDNAEVEKLAESTACKGEVGCRAQKTRMERTPIAQTFDYAVAKKTVTVRCTRGMLFVGDYTCEAR
jgi:hypothetical protein